MVANLWELKAFPGFSGVPTSWILTFNDEPLYALTTSDQPSNVDKTQTLQSLVLNLNRVQGEVIFNPTMNTTQFTDKTSAISSPQNPAISVTPVTGVTPNV